MGVDGNPMDSSQSGLTLITNTLTAAMNIPDLRDLPLEQRLHLVEDLWDSIAADQGALALTDAQREELDRRLDAYENDSNPGRDAKFVLDDLRKRL